MVCADGGDGGTDLRGREGVEGMGEGGVRAHGAGCEGACVKGRMR